MAHDECPCLLCLFLYRPCGFSGFGRSLGGIPSSLTGALGGGILLFDGLLLLPTGKRVAGKLGIFLQRFLVQDIYISLFQLTLCLGCFSPLPWYNALTFSREGVLYYVRTTEEDTLLHGSAGPCMSRQTVTTYQNPIK